MCYYFPLSTINDGVNSYSLCFVLKASNNFIDVTQCDWQFSFQTYLFDKNFKETIFSAPNNEFES